MESRAFIRRIEVTSLVVGLLATAVSAISLDPVLIGGVFIGAAIGWLNLAVVRLLFERGARMPERRGAVMAAFVVKSVLLLGMVSIVVFGIGVDGIGFIVGFSSAVVAIVAVATMHFLSSPSSAGAGDEGGLHK